MRLARPTRGSRYRVSFISVINCIVKPSPFTSTDISELEQVQFGFENLNFSKNNHFPSFLFDEGVPGPRSFFQTLAAGHLANLTCLNVAFNVIINNFIS